MTKIAHISDIHLGPLPSVSPRQLLSKRITGYANWKLARKNALPFGMLERLVDHLKSQKPDLIVVSGDLVNLALPEEFEHAKTFLKALGSAQKVAVIPGNHDAYLPHSMAMANRAWSDYMRGEHITSEQFPFWRQRDEVALIGCSSAIATPFFCSFGTFDEAQGERLAKILQKTGAAGLYRVVMIHHPPHDAVKQIWRRGLYGREIFRDVIKTHGAELVLHGHLHKTMRHWLEGPNGKIPLVGGASAAAGNGGKHSPAQYNLFEIGKNGDKFNCKMTEFGYEASGEHIVEKITPEQRKI